MHIYRTRLKFKHHDHENHLRDVITTRSPERRNSRASAFPNPLVLENSKNNVSVKPPNITVALTVFCFWETLFLFRICYTTISNKKENIYKSSQEISEKWTHCILLPSKIFRRHVKIRVQISYLPVMTTLRGPALQCSSRTLFVPIIVPIITPPSQLYQISSFIWLSPPKKNSLTK